MNPDPSGVAAREFFAELMSLHEKLFSERREGPLALSEIESLDLVPLVIAQSRLDEFGQDALSTLSPEDQLLLLHLSEAIIGVLGPFSRDDGPLAARILSLSGKGPLAAYQKAARDGSALFEKKMIGRL
ncbi:MAG: hypothetical protein VST70_07125 [Nitrospirota bacterium]|nr:hypothetical protein [Nitrospirota bacterium]